MLNRSYFIQLLIIFDILDNRARQLGHISLTSLFLILIVKAVHQFFLFSLQTLIPSGQFNLCTNVIADQTGFLHI